MKNTEGKYFEFYERLEKLLDYHIKFLNHTILVDVFDDNRLFSLLMKNIVT